MPLFDTKVQQLKYSILCSVAKHAWEGDLNESLLSIPKEIIPGNVPTMRCCVYKERAIVAERVKMAVGGSRRNPNVIETLDIACDECPTGGYIVTENCRGCIAHRCEDVCPVGAITHDEDHHAHINKEKCVNCGKCAEACPYSAIYNRKRPCQIACKVGAIQMHRDGTVKIDNDLCLSCGACVYQCPFGALSDKSFVVDVIGLLKSGERVAAILAPSFASQFSYAEPEQIVSAVKALGFDMVTEAALGADMVAYSEAEELAQTGFLTSSCCPAFVTFIQKNFPELTDKISHNLSPMAATGKWLKEKDPELKTVFIGPCTAKKREAQLEEQKKYVDFVLTFEELQALMDSREINAAALEGSELEDASGYGRIFAHAGGLSAAAAQALKEKNAEFELKPISCSGIDECKLALLKASKGRADFNFLEGMACYGGCVNGAGCITHNPKNKVKIDSHSGRAKNRSIAESLAAAGAESFETERQGE